MMNKAVIAVLFALVCVANSDDTVARLLASKNVLNRNIVEGKDLTVEYNIYNVGGSAAFGVKLNDDSFPEPDFEKVQGLLQVSWERIAPGTNVSHVVVLRPTKAGYFNFTSAHVNYLGAEESKEQLFGYTSAPGYRDIIPNKEYDRRFSPHMVDWAAFAVMTLPSIGIPFLLWFSSSKKYDTQKPKKH